MTTTDKKYFAFISYKREDEEWAKWLQHKLEHYKLPSNLNGRTDLPKEIRPVFKDTSELNPGNLPQQIHDALDQSRYLIVICSPRSAKSEWVNKEVETFIGMGRTDKIIPFIIDGKAFAKNPEEECFPLAIRNLPAEQEILGANISEMGRDAAAVKVVAQMFGLKFDELWQRHEREQRKKHRITISAITAFAIMVLAVTGWIWHQNTKLKEKDWKLMENRSRFVAERAKAFVDDGDSYTACRLLLEVLPKNVNNPIDLPYTAEAEMSLRKAISYNTTRLKGHKKPVDCAIFSPDGSRIASTSEDNTIMIWDAENGKLLKTMEIPGASSLVFSPDGHRIAAINYQTVMILDVDSGELLHTLEGHTFSIKSICYSHDGRRIVSASLDDTAKIWDAESGELLLSLEHPGSVFDVSYSPDDRHILSSAYDRKCRIWDAENGALLKTFPTKDSYNATYSPDGQRFVSYNSRKIIIFDAESGEPLDTINSGLSSMESARYSPDGKHIIARFDYSWYDKKHDNIIMIWDTESGELQHKLEGFSSNITCASYSPDGRRIVLALNDKTIQLLDLCSEDVKEPIRSIPSHQYSSASFSPDGSRILIEDGHGVTTWDADSGTLVNTLINGYLDYDPDLKNAEHSLTEDGFRLFTLDADSGALVNNRVYADDDPYLNTAVYSPDGQSVLITYINGNIVIIDSESGKTLSSWHYKGDEELLGDYGNLHYATYSPDGSKIAAASEDCCIRIWDSKSNELIKTIKDTKSVYAVSYSNDGRRIVSRASDGSIRIWDSDNGKLLRTLEQDQTRAYSFDCTPPIFSPDDRFIVATLNDQYYKIGIWDSESGKLVTTLTGHTDKVTSASYSPDGHYIVSSSDDRSVRVWDSQSGILIQVFDVDKDKSYNYYSSDIIYSGIVSAFFSPDGRHIVSSASGVSIWDFPPLQELIDQTRERFKDNPLTPEERKQYYLE